MIAFLDIETSGLNKQKHALCEIGLVITDNDLNIVHKWQTYIKPYGMEYTDKAMAVNAITMEQLEGGVGLRFALMNLSSSLSIFGVETIICHNTLFDMGWIDYLNVIHLNHRIIGMGYICTLQLSRKHFKAPHDLDNLCNRFGIEKNGHNALGDAIACLELYKRIINK